MKHLELIIKRFFYITFFQFLYDFCPIILLLYLEIYKFKNLIRKRRSIVDERI